MDFIDPDGYGNCLKRDSRFLKSPYSCYVKEPSLCPDKKNFGIPDVIDIEKSISAIACLGKITSITVTNHEFP